MSLRSASLLVAALLASTAASAAQMFDLSTTPTRSDSVATASVDPNALFSLTPPAPAQAATTTAPTATEVDDRALRFYASRNETARVAAEIRRLRALHPDWTPPQDLFEPGRDDSVEQPLWPLLQEGRFDEIRAIVGRVRSERPDWRPSGNFSKQFEEALAVASIRQASDAGDHARVVEFAGAAPSVLSCRSVDTLWRVGEALARTGDPARAEALYTFVLTTCPDPGERLATVQKATLLLPRDAVDRLVEVGKRSGSPGEIGEVAYSILLGRVGTATSEAGGFVAPDELARVEALATERRDDKGFEILGWHAFVTLRDFPRAERMFRQSVSLGRNTKSVEGLGLALREQGRLEEAEQLTFEWRSADPLIEKLFIEIVAAQLTRPDVIDFPADRLQRYSRVVEESANANGAQAIGWLYYKQENATLARRWFELAVSVEPGPDNIVGLALVAHGTGDRELVRRLSAEHGDRVPMLAEIASWRREEAPQPRATAASAPRSGSSAQARRAVALYEAGRYREAIEVIDAAGSALARDHGMQVLRGWALLKQNRGEDAYRAFDRADRMRRTADTVAGKHWTMQQMFGGEGRSDAVGFFQQDAFMRRIESEQSR